MQFLICALDALNRRIGKVVCWLALGMVLMQFAIVVLRYVFGWNAVAMQESVIYMHGFMFMLGAAWSLIDDQHVRVDVFYREASPRRKAWVNLVGSVLLLLPFCIVIWAYSFPYVLESWQVFEGSRDGGGLKGVFLLKTVILFFAVQMALGAVSLALKSWLVLFPFSRGAN